MGVQMPRNTSDQAARPAFHHPRFSDKGSHEVRMKVLAKAQIDDLICIPGHAMMWPDKINDQPYVIEDVGDLVFKDGSDNMRWTKANEASATPLPPLRVNENLSNVDAMTGLVHLGQ